MVTVSQAARHYSLHIGHLRGVPAKEAVRAQKPHIAGNRYGIAAEVSVEALTVDLVDGRTIMVPLVWYPRLWHGTSRERNHLQIFGDGTYIHWPALDEDLTVAGLLAGRRSGESPQSLRKWLESRKRKKRRADHGPSNKRMQPARQERTRS